MRLFIKHYLWVVKDYRTFPNCHIFSDGDEVTLTKFILRCIILRPAEIKVALIHEWHQMEIWSGRETNLRGFQCMWVLSESRVGGNGWSEETTCTYMRKTWQPHTAKRLCQPLPRHTAVISKIPARKLVILPVRQTVPWLQHSVSLCIQHTKMSFINISRNLYYQELIFWLKKSWMSGEVFLCIISLGDSQHTWPCSRDLDFPPPMNRVSRTPWFQKFRTFGNNASIY